jgi:hypothetical protein
VCQPPAQAANLSAGHDFLRSKTARADVLTTVNVSLCGPPGPTLFPESRTYGTVHAPCVSRQYKQLNYLQAMTVSAAKQHELMYSPP